MTKVRCDDCEFAVLIRKKNEMGDAYCPTADKTLIGALRNRKALRQPRNCAEFKPT